MNKLNAVLTAIAPYRKAVAGALSGVATVLAAEGEISWQSLAKAAIAGSVTGGAVYRVTNTPKA